MMWIRRLRWLLFFTNGERNEIRQGLHSNRIGNDDARRLLKELA